MGPFENFRKFCLFFEIYAKKIAFDANLKLLFFRKLNDGILMLRKENGIILEIIAFEHNPLVVTDFLPFSNKKKLMQNNRVFFVLIS